MPPMAGSFDTKWLIKLLRRWADMLTHPDGGFADGADAEGRVDFSAPRSLLVQARLAYSFALAHEMAQKAAIAAPWARAAADIAFDAITSQLSLPDGGFATSVGSTGGPAGDATIDFYNIAFVILAAAQLHRIAPDTNASKVMEATIRFLDDSLAHPAGGFAETSLGSPNGRRQNPHMHLLEAQLAAFEATGETLWLERARAIVDLFLSRFFDEETGSLVEFMTEALAPLPGDRGGLREPGHHFEWVWLLLDYHGKSRDVRVLKPAQALYASASAHGLAHRGDAFDVVESMTRDGRPVSGDRLLWPQTEYVKAEVARHVHLDAAGALDAARAHFSRIRRVYFREASPLWRNRLDAQGAALDSFVPARVLYHVAFAAQALAIAGDP